MKVRNQSQENTTMCKQVPLDPAANLHIQLDVWAAMGSRIEEACAMHAPSFAIRGASKGIGNIRYNLQVHGHQQVILMDQPQVTTVHIVLH